MKPVNFPEHNKIYAKDQKEYLPLPVHESDINGGMTISCWQLSFIEKIKIMFSGKLWILVMNFRQPLQPIRPQIEYPFERKPK